MMAGMHTVRLAHAGMKPYMMILVMMAKMHKMRLAHAGKKPYLIILMMAGMYRLDYYPTPYI